MKKLILNHKRNFSFLCVAGVLFAFTQLGFTWIFAEFIKFGDNKSIFSMNSLLIITCVYIVLSIFIKMYRSNINNKFVQEIRENYQENILKSFFSGRYKSEKSEGFEIKNMLLSDLNILEQDALGPLSLLVSQSAIFIFSIVYALDLNPQLLIIAIALNVFSLVISKTMIAKSKDLKSEMSENKNIFLTLLEDLVNGYHTIVNYKAEDQFIKVTRKKISQSEDSYKKSKTYLDYINVYSGSANSASYLFTLLFGLYQLKIGKIQLYQLMAFSSLMQYFISPITLILDSLNRIKSSEKIIDKLNTASNYSTHLDNPVNVNEKIEFQNVSLEIGEKNILNNIDLVIEKGKKYLIVGESGSGKSTLLKLLLNYYGNYQNLILVDDKNLKNFSRIGNLSHLEQSGYIFNDTIKNNLTLYSDNYNEKQLYEYINIVGLGDTITNIEKSLKGNENTLSGGERKRIEIIRALITTPDILLVDEATSSLDAKTSEIVEELLLSLKDITIVNVTHKLTKEILEKYDEIIYLEKGKIVEKGSFKELMEKKEKFQILYEKSI